MGGNQPRELAKRYNTKTDRRLLNIGINKDVSDRLAIPTSFPIRFEYYYDSFQNKVLHTIDVVGQANFLMDIGETVKFNDLGNGRDIMIPAVAKSVIDADRTMVVNFVWVVRMRIEDNFMVGMANIDLYINATKGQTEIKPAEFSWTFDETA